MGAPFSTDLKRCSRCLLPETHETLCSMPVCATCASTGGEGRDQLARAPGTAGCASAGYRGRYRYDCLVPSAVEKTVPGLSST